MIRDNKNLKRASNSVSVLLGYPISLIIFSLFNKGRRYVKHFVYKGREMHNIVCIFGRMQKALIHPV